MACLMGMTSSTTEPTTGTEGTEFPRVDPLDQGPNRSRKILVIVAVGLAVTTIAWLYIIFGYRPELLIDELADKTFPRQAEEICAAAKTQLEELPYASQARSADERADSVAESNRILDEMLDDLETIAPSEPPVAKEAVAEWLGDWRTYLGDRQAYVSNLRKDSSARFLETAKGDPNKGITRAITSFSQVNRMQSCATPADLS